MNELSQLLCQATARVPPQYFEIEIDGGDPVYRERVYCYELYHQLRCVWPQNSPFYLNGELDKAAHPILKELGASHAKPDLLIHQPGYMSGNDTIIEVKSCRSKPKGIKKDLNMLSLFTQKVGYRRAIFLIYGTGAEVILEKTRLIAGKIPGLSSIEVWLHPIAGQPAYEVSNLII